MKKPVGLSKEQEHDRAVDTAKRNICYISKTRLEDADVVPCWHEGAEFFVRINRKFTTDKEKPNEQIEKSS